MGPAELADDERDPVVGEPVDVVVHPRRGAVDAVHVDGEHDVALRVAGEHRGGVVAHQVVAVLTVAGCVGDEGVADARAAQPADRVAGLADPAGVGAAAVRLVAEVDDDVTLLADDGASDGDPPVGGLGERGRAVARRVAGRVVHLQDADQAVATALGHRGGDGGGIGYVGESCI
ncbi:hypothetical protein GCM10027610_031970 [Dactylosporangium cerinum]